MQIYLKFTPIFFDTHRFVICICAHPKYLPYFFQTSTCIYIYLPILLPNNNHFSLNLTSLTNASLSSLTNYGKSYLNLGFRNIKMHGNITKSPKRALAINKAVKTPKEEVGINREILTIPNPKKRITEVRIIGLPL